MRRLAEAHALTDRDPIKDATKLFRDINRELRDIISRHLPEYERVIGLTAANPEFRAKLTDAIIECVFTHRLTPYHKRIGHIRRDLAEARKESVAAIESLRRLTEILEGFPQELSDAFSEHWGTSGEVSRHSLDRQMEWLKLVSLITGFYVEGPKLDKGGAPKMVAFNVLAKGLADAFKIGTGQEATVYWGPIDERWHSNKFLELVEDVLSLVKILADPEAERPLRVPLAMGKYLRELTHRRKGGKTRARSTKPRGERRG